MRFPLLQASLGLNEIAWLSDSSKASYETRLGDTIEVRCTESSIDHITMLFEEQQRALRLGNEAEDFSLRNHIIHHIHRLYVSDTSTKEIREQVQERLGPWEALFLLKAYSMDPENPLLDETLELLCHVLLAVLELELDSSSDICLVRLIFDVSLEIEQIRHEDLETRCYCLNVARYSAAAMNRIDFLAYALYIHGEFLYEHGGDFGQGNDVRKELVELATKFPNNNLVQAFNAMLGACFAVYTKQREDIVRLNNKVLHHLESYTADTVFRAGYMPLPQDWWALICRERARKRISTCEMDSFEDVFDEVVSRLLGSAPQDSNTLWGNPEDRKRLWNDVRDDLTSRLEEDKDDALYLLRRLLIAEWCLGFPSEELELRYAEAEKLAENRHVLLSLSYFRGLMYYFRGADSDASVAAQALERLEMCVRKFFELFYTFQSGALDSRGRILYDQGWKGMFRALQALYVDKWQEESDMFGAVIWAERELARDLLYSLKEDKVELQEFDTNDEKAKEVVVSILESNPTTAFLMYSSLSSDRPELGLVIYLLHYNLFLGTPSPCLMFLHSSVEHKFTDINDVERESLSDWYRKLIPKELEEALEMLGPDKLVILPGEELFEVPFAALFDEEREKYLIQLYPISYAPSLRTYKHCQMRAQELMQSSKRRQSKALVIGNPSGAGLQAAEEEAEVITGLLRSIGLEVDLQLGEDATKEAAQRAWKESHWVHVASHAAVGGSYPRGALLLALSSEDDVSSASIFLRQMQKIPSSSVLTGDEIAESSEFGNIKLPTLVTILSACQTGLGEVFTEGLLGLYRSLHVAGVATVVASLWKVDDDATRVLMERLYNNLSSGVEITFALQAAMVSMIEERDDFDLQVYPEKMWAAFMTSGSPEGTLMRVTEASD